MTATRLAIVGAGWRAQFFRRLAALLPDELTLVGAAVRRTEAADAVRDDWGVPVWTSPAELLAGARPQLVVSSVPWEANPGVVTELVAGGARVLSETPPAPDADGLRSLWQQVGGQDRVHVAEQYLLMPGHAARWELLRRGVIGRPTSVQVSSTHTYHAVSMIRGLLGVGFEPVVVNAQGFAGPLVDPLVRDAWTDDPEEKRAGSVLATMRFEQGGADGDPWGVYDFTDNQWHNQLRHRRIVIRGSHGEIADDDVVRLTGPRTILRSQIRRSQLGYDLNLDGFDTEHLSFDGSVLYRNPFLGCRLMDEEIAIADVLRSAARWARDEAAGPYPLAQACQDHLIGLAIEESLATGAEVRTGRQIWAD